MTIHIESLYTVDGKVIFMEDICSISFNASEKNKELFQHLLSSENPTCIIEVDLKNGRTYFIDIFESYNLSNPHYKYDFTKVDVERFIYEFITCYFQSKKRDTYNSKFLKQQLMKDAGYDVDIDKFQDVPF